MNRPIATTALAAILSLAAAGASAQATAPKTEPQKTAAPAAQHQAQNAAHPAAKATLVDLNTATREQLMALPGMTETYADAIIKGRPFNAPHDLVSRKLLPEATYKKLEHQLTVEKKKG